MRRTSRVTEDGRATIPTDLRDEYGIGAGDEVVWEGTDDGIVLRKRRGSARGTLVPDGTSAEKREEVARELERRVEEIRERNDPSVTD